MNQQYIALIGKESEAQPNDRYLKEELVAEVEADTIAISALEKQIPKEPIFDSGNRLCGECSEIIKAYESHCPFCGQAIKKE